MRFISYSKPSFRGSHHMPLLGSFVPTIPLLDSYQAASPAFALQYASTTHSSVEIYCSILRLISIDLFYS